ncbi:MAG: 50S ribosomal protein L9 [Dehalococcoidia bacterium]
MKVVFLEEVEGSGRIGDVKTVADGYARNYLLPRRLAAPATAHYLGVARAKADKEARRLERLDEEARQYLLPKVDGQSVAVEVLVGEQGKLFGSVTPRDVAEALARLAGIELEHRQVEMDPIRELGSLSVPVYLTRNVVATVEVNVVPLTEEAPEEPAAKPARKRATKPKAKKEAAPKAKKEAAPKAKKKAAPKTEAEAAAEAEAPEAVEAEAEARTDAKAGPVTEAPEGPEAEADPEGTAEQADASSGEETS